MDPLSLYGLFEHFNVQIRVRNSHHFEGNYLVYKVYEIYDVIFIKGSRGPSYLTIEVR